MEARDSSHPQRESRIASRRERIVASFRALDQQKDIFRTRSQALVFLGVGLFHAVFAVFFLWDFLSGDTGILWLVGLESIPVLVMVVCFRAGRARVEVRDSSVRIVNPLRTVTLPACDIAHFVVGASGLLSKVAIAHLRDGQHLRAFGIQGPNPATRPANRDAETLVDALNRRIAAAAAA